MQQLLVFLNELDERKIYYRLNRVQKEGIMVNISVPGQHWEVEFMDDCFINIERFISSGDIFDSNEISELFADFEDKDVQEISTFLNALDERKICYRLNKTRADTIIMVEISVPGQFWEVEFMDDSWTDSIWIEKFISTGQIIVCKEINQCKEIERLFADFSD